MLVDSANDKWSADYLQKYALITGSRKKAVQEAGDGFVVMNVRRNADACW